MNMADQKNMLWGELRRAEPMARHTSWRAGGSVDRAYVPVDLEDMRLFIASLPPNEPLYVVGLGSNLLVRDGGLRGTVIFTHGSLKEIRAERTVIYAEGGVPSPKLARFAALHELVGAEFMAGVPGTVGGALAMNQAVMAVKPGASSRALPRWIAPACCASVRRRITKSVIAA